MRYLFIAALLPMVLFCACSKPETGGEEKPVVQMSVTPAALEFDWSGGTKSLSVTCGAALTSVKADSWLAFNTGSFSGNRVTVDVTAAENATSAERKSTITILGETGVLKVPVTQGIKSIPLEVSASSFSADCSGSYGLSFTVTSTTDPTISSAANWCVTEAGKIDSDRKTEVKLYIGANRTSKDRSNEITVKCGNESKTIKITQKAWSVETVAATALTPEMVFDALKAGWNLGNQMDATNNDVASETAWGNSKCTQSTMDGVKKAGFSSVRIPVTWMGHIGAEGAYKIEDKWMDRVAEIAEYAHKAGLYAIINTHHDENDNGSSAHWLDIKSATTNSARNEKIKDEIFCVWSQIAERFKDCGEWLIFEPFNEIQDGGWGWSDSFRTNPAAQYKVLNEWNQVFVDAVRATGGNNATRWLATVGYAQSSGSISIDGLVIPKDYTSANRMIVGFHNYDPYLYTINNPLVEQWGHTADPDKRVSNTDEANAVYVYDLFKSTYIDKGIPVYLGEMGCSFHSGDNFKYQKYYIEYNCKAAADRLIPMMIWDNGAKGSGAECHSYIDHGTGKITSDQAREIIDLMVKAVTDKRPDYTLESIYKSAP